MPLTTTETESSSNRMNILWRLLVLRVFVIFCVIIAISCVHFILNKNLNLIAIHLTLLAAIFYSGFSFIYYQSRTSITKSILVQQLLFDTLLLAIIVYYTGRSANPFIYYWLVIVAISSTIFKGKAVVFFTSLTIFLYSAMMYCDVSNHSQHTSTEFQLHLVGMWINFVGSALLISFFIARLAKALRKRQILLSKAREETLKNEQLVGIGTVAASTVHALGTPLSTLSMLIEELEETPQQQSGNPPPFSDTLATMRTQIQRCKETMSKLSLLAEKQKELLQPMHIKEFADEIKSHYEVVGISPMPVFTIEESCGQGFIAHSILLNHAIINLVDNAIQASKTFVQLDFKVSINKLIITIEDDGTGFSSESIEQWGKPQLSSKHEGLGIGVFLANSTIEKMHGKIAIQSSNNANTTMQITLPLLSETK